MAYEVGLPEFRGEPSKRVVIPFWGPFKSSLKIASSPAISLRSKEDHLVEVKRRRAVPAVPDVSRFCNQVYHFVIPNRLSFILPPLPMPLRVDVMRKCLHKVSLRSPQRGCSTIFCQASAHDAGTKRRRPDCGHLESTPCAGKIPEETTQTRYPSDQS